MSFYSKINLFALLAAGTALGMELPPRLKAPATSAAAQAINQPIITITRDGNLIDKIPKNYLECSETLKDLLKETEHDNAIELPDSMLEDFNWITPILEYEYKLKNKLVSKYFISTYLQASGYTIKDLVLMLNACQRFELNKMSKTILYTLIHGSERSLKKCKDTCLQTGFYQLPWTDDVARLIAKKMLEENPFFYKSLLTDFTEHKQGKICFWRIEQNTSNRIIKRIAAESSDFYRQNLDHFLSVKQIIGTHWLSDHQELMIDQRWSQQHGLINNSHILVSTISEESGTSTLYWQIDSEILKSVTGLKPEQVTILKEYYPTKVHAMPTHLKDKLPASIKQILFPNWWQRRSFLAKAAIITGGVAATGLAAWMGYKYFSKK